MISTYESLLECKVNTLGTRPCRITLSNRCLNRNQKQELHPPTLDKLHKRCAGKLTTVGPFVRLEELLELSHLSHHPNFWHCENQEGQVILGVMKSRLGGAES